MIWVFIASLVTANPAALPPAILPLAFRIKKTGKKTLREPPETRHSVKEIKYLWTKFLL